MKAPQIAAPKPALSILDAMSDPELFARWFKGSSWSAWRSSLAALFALPLTDDALDTYRTARCTCAGPTWSVHTRETMGARDIRGGALPWEGTMCCPLAPNTSNLGSPKWIGSHRF